MLSPVFKYWPWYDSIYNFRRLILLAWMTTLFHFKVHFLLRHHDVTYPRLSDLCGSTAATARASLARLPWRHGRHTRGKHVRIGYKYNLSSRVGRLNIYPTEFNIHHQLVMPSFDFASASPQCPIASQTYLNGRRSRHIRGTARRPELPDEPSRLGFALHCQPPRAASHSLARLHHLCFNAYTFSLLFKKTKTKKDLFIFI